MTKDKLLALSKHAGIYYEALQEGFERYRINTPKRQAMFLAQVAHESAGFKVVEENLNYSAKALRDVFGKYFTSDAMAAEYARKPEKIANLVYANRMGNGDPASGDGFKHRGVGLIQLTGKRNQLAYSLDRYGDDRIIKNPSMLTEPADAGMSACWFWNSRSLNAYADDGDIRAVTKRINGGLNGYEDRKEWWAIARRVLGA